MTSEPPPPPDAPSPRSDPSTADPTAEPAPAPGAPGSHRHTTDDFFDRIRSLGVVRPSEGRWVAGVASGLARRWDVDEVLVRGVFVALAVLGGVGVAAYGLAWLLLPQEDGRIHLQSAIRGDITAGFVGSVILTLSAIGSGSGPWHDGSWFGWGFPGGLFLTGLVVFAIWWFARRDAGPGGSGTTFAAGGPAGGAPTTTPSGSGPAGSAGSAGSGGSTPVYGSPPAGGAYGSSPAERYRLGEDGRQRAEAASRAAQARNAEAQRRRSATAPSKPIVRATLGIALIAAAAILVLGRANDW
jgi:phage shock protein PspC (stress-responsive transcriptional regulator)